MRWRALASALAVLALAACAGPKPRATVPAAPSGPPVAAPSGVKLGKPYVVFGVTYVPADDRDYDEKGIASWYGPGFHRGPTANGETYDQDDLTAAHKTLPLPSWVEVTNLDNGRQLVVRINDRGPFVEGRIIDLSRRSAQLLGVDGPGLARVRVRRVYPAGDWALSTPPLKPVAPVLATPVPAAGAPARTARPATATSLFVQVAALSDAGRAEYLAGELSDIAPGRTSPAPNGLWRVRLGPFTSEAEASDVMARLAARGFAGARLVREGA
ncbi:septal ring lytic transglycosylase RlpA family protein [Thermaurantiacus sp.]